MRDRPFDRASTSPLAGLGGAVLHALSQWGRAALMLFAAFRWLVRGRWEIRETIV
jgi:hypothetical protein